VQMEEPLDVARISHVHRVREGRNGLMRLPRAGSEIVRHRMIGIGGENYLPHRKPHDKMKLKAGALRNVDKTPLA
jgi:hypothetical protein